MPYCYANMIHPDTRMVEGQDKYDVLKMISLSYIQAHHGSNTYFQSELLVMTTLLLHAMQEKGMPSLAPFGSGGTRTEWSLRL